MRAKVPNRIDPCRNCLHKRSCDTYAHLKQVEGDIVPDLQDDDATLEWCEISTYDKQLQILLHCKRFEEDIDAT